MAKKEVNLFPYQYKLSGINNTTSNLMSIFNKKNVQKNAIPYLTNALHLLILEKEDGNFLYGKFIKLRKDAPNILDRLSGRERSIKLKDDEDIEEMSHFIWNVDDCIILAEYNYYAIRSFANPLSRYLNKIFGTKDNIVIPIMDIDTYRKFIESKKGIKSFRLAVSRFNLNILEKHLNLSITEVADFSSNKESYIEFYIKKGKGEDFLNKNKVVEVVDHLKDDIDAIKTFQIEEEDAVYDLIKSNLLHYFRPIEKIGRYINASEFYRKAKELYLEKIPEIKKSIRSL